MRSYRKGSSTAKPVTEAFSTPGLSTAPVAGGERVHMTYLESRKISYKISLLKPYFQMCSTYTPSKYVPDFSLAGGGGEAGRERPERWKCVNMLGLGWAGEGRGVRVWSWALQLDRPLPGPSHRHHPRPADTSNTIHHPVTRIHTSSHTRVQLQG